MMAADGFETLRVRFADRVCFMQLCRPGAHNAINGKLVEELSRALAACESEAVAVVLEGLPEVFCLGLDFSEIGATPAANGRVAESLYDLWTKLCHGPFVTVAHVRGKANAGGVGFAAACDIVLANETAQFGLSELLLGLTHACVLPFLTRRVGMQRANYLSIATTPIGVEQAHAWGLVDAHDPDSDRLVHKHLLRVRRMSKSGIERHKRYIADIDDSVARSRSMAVETNGEMLSDAGSVAGIVRYVQEGVFPWEA
jgi:polyketide biosynthesis enoyl-CoA hydratase PksH